MFVSFNVKRSLLAQARRRVLFGIIFLLTKLQVTQLTQRLFDLNLVIDRIGL